MPCCTMRPLAATLGGVHELAAFPDVVADGLFHVHVLSRGDGGHGDERVRVVRRRDGDGIHLLVLDELAVIRVGLTCCSSCLSFATS